MLLLHLVAWGVPLAIGVAVVHANMREQGGMIGIIGSFNRVLTESQYSHGWPADYFVRKETTTKISFPKQESTTKSSSTFHYFGLICNVVVGLFLLATTGFVFLPLLWKRKLFQIKLETLFILTATAAVLCVVYRESYVIDSLLREFAVTSILWLPPYLKIPLGFGICCAIYTGIWIVYRLATALVKLLLKRRVVVQGE